MKYFIYTNHQLEEVASMYYEVWHSLFAHEYMLEDYVYVGSDAVHYLETMYVGALDKDEWDEPLPFVIFYGRDILTVTDNGIEVEVENDILYFASYEEMVAGREREIRDFMDKI